MIRCLATGVLYRDPEPQTSQTGKPYVRAKLRADGKDGGSTWVSLIAFGELAERLAALKAGAALAVSGRADVNAWTGKDGNPAAGLSLVADELATLRGKPKPKPAPTPAPSDTALPFDDLGDWQP